MASMSTGRRGSGSGGSIPNGIRDATKKAEGLPTEVAHVESTNGHAEAPRRSSADVLNRAGAAASQ